MSGAEEKVSGVETQPTASRSSPAQRLFPLETRGLLVCYLLIVAVIACSIWIVGLSFQEQCVSFSTLRLLPTFGMVTGVTLLGVVLGDVISRLCRVDDKVYLATRAVTWIPWAMHACGIAWIAAGFLWVKVILPNSSGRGHGGTSCSQLGHFYHSWVVISMFILLSLSIVITLINKLLYIARTRGSRDLEKATMLNT